MFLGRELTSETVTTVDDDGATRTHTTHEAAWTDEDRQWLLAYLAEKAGECPGCGHPREETHDPATEFAYIGDPSRCHSCKAADRALEPFRSEHASAAGIYISTRRR